MGRVKIRPVPSSSRVAPSRVSPKVKPKPMPMPSKILAMGPFFAANASARPRMMQFTTMRGMKSQSVAERSGR